MSDDSSLFNIDVRDVVQHMKDKSYHSLGEAFESFFHTYFDLDEVTGDVVFTVCD